MALVTVQRSPSPSNSAADSVMIFHINYVTQDSYLKDNSFINNNIIKKKRKSAASDIELINS